jgi:outer membrane protein assembly factor BamB
VAVDLDFGRIRWELDPLAAANVDDRLQPHLQIVGSRLLAWSDRNVFVIDRERGEIVGRTPILHDVAGLPAAAAGDRIFLVGGRDRIVAVREKTAETLWTRSTGWPSWDAPVLYSNGRDALLTILDGYALSRLDPATGEPLWEIAASKSPRSGFDRLGFAREDRFYLGAPEGLDCRSLEDGRLIWRAEATGLVDVAVDARPRRGVKIVGLEKGRGLPTVKAWNLHDGTLDWACRIEPLCGDVRLESMEDAPAILSKGGREAPADDAESTVRP